MVYIILFIILGITFFVIVKFVKSTTPRGFARELAKAQLFSLKVVKQKFPEKNKEDQYFLALKTRPNYSEEEIRAIIREAKKSSKELKGEFNFQTVIFHMAVKEFTKRTNIGSPLRRDGVGYEILQGVSEIIPEDT